LGLVGHSRLRLASIAARLPVTIDRLKVIYQKKGIFLIKFP
jgi:hypothetical protein